MPLIDITNPDIIKFLVENYDKTARLRMKWNSLYGEKLKQAATLQREEKGYYELDVIKEAMAAGMPTISRDFLSGAPNKRKVPIRDGINIPTTKSLMKGNSIVDVKLGTPEEDPRLARPDEDLSEDPIMRPVDFKQKKIIYDGIPNFGRLVYLKSRVKMSPENRYYFPECSGWVYGWRLKDSYFSNTAPEYGRVWRLHNDLQGRSGPHPDPVHYNKATVIGMTLCVDD